MNVRRTTLLVAIVLAIGTGWLTLTYLSALRPPSNEQRPVLIASQEIAARSRIVDTMFSKETRSAQALLEPDALSEPSQAVGSLALVTIPAGAQLDGFRCLDERCVSPFLVRLQPGMRAVSIPVDRVKDVSGLIQPGDRVDVIAIPPSKQNGPPPKAVTIFRGIRVLAVGNALENPSATPSPQEQEASTVTLEVTPHQADILAWADTNATLRLALRSPRESIRAEPIEALTITGNTVAAAPPPVAPAPAGFPTAPAPRDPPVHRFLSPVELIIGDQIVDPDSPTTPAIPTTPGQ